MSDPLSLTWSDPMPPLPPFQLDLDHPLLEAVPNFSEGRNPEIIQALAQALAKGPGVKLLHVDAGYDANRTVYSLVGPPQGVLASLLEAILLACRLIDMTQHQGEHPRLGACDVCPLIPLAGLSREDAVHLSLELANLVAAKAQIPVYLYEHSAKRPERRSLAQIRQGGYEGLAQKLGTSQGQPDLGPARFVPQSGALVMGARDLLLAYNINLKGASLSQAQEIAALVRESGSWKQLGPEKVHQPGLLPGVRAMGWQMPQMGLAQVSTNLVDLSQTGPLQVFATVRQLAQERGLDTQGSELIGLAPASALVPDLPLGHPAWMDRLQQNVKELGLDALSPFVPQERILELTYQARVNP